MVCWVVTAFGECEEWVGWGGVRKGWQNEYWDCDMREREKERENQNCAEPFCIFEIRETYYFSPGVGLCG